MILSSILSFLGGAAARAIIGQAIDWLKAKQEHAQEMDRLRLQGELDEKRAARQDATIRLQAELGVKQLEVAGDAEVKKLEAAAFAEAMKSANVPTGVRWVDAWNGTIRPLSATIALTLWFLELLKAAFVLTDWDRNLIASILGYYFADRHIAKRSG
jgi:hypothetical protein